ncbi:MAG: hypothetical protein ACJAXH_001778 [Colwellia sp.]
MPVKTYSLSALSEGSSVKDKILGTKKRSKAAFFGFNPWLFSFVQA